MRAEDPKWRQGRAGETAIRRWLQEQGYYVIPVADIEGHGAPMLEGLRDKAVLPDLMASIRGTSRWVEVKTKGKATYYQNAKRWEHGLLMRHWADYLACQEQTGMPGWLCVWELESGMALLADMNRLDKVARFYHGTGMPDRQPHVFFPRDAFDWYDGPNAKPPTPITPLAPRTLAQPPAPTTRQLEMSL